MIALFRALQRAVARLGLLCAALPALLAVSAWGAPPLWEVEAPNGGRAWLFGSIHLCTAQCFPLPEAALRAFDAADALALELDPTSPTTAARVLERGMYAPNDALDQHLDAALVGEVTAALAKFGIDAGAVLRMRPWMLADMLTVMSAQNAGMALEHGVDLWFLARARARGKPVLELETADEQIDSMDKLPDRAQQDMLQQALGYRDENRLKRELAALLAAWQAGDADRLASLIRAELAGSDHGAQIFESVLTRRNTVLAERIAKHLGSGQQIFVVIGAAHLAGRADLPTLLTAQGYRVRRVR